MMLKDKSVHEKELAGSDLETEGGAIADRIDPLIERRVLRKCDFWVVSSTTVLFLLSFLDRINIGNARIQGLEKDLHMRGHQFNVALLIIFPAFILFEIPSNLILKRVAPSTWLSFLLFACGSLDAILLWGRIHLRLTMPFLFGQCERLAIMTIAQGFVKSFGALLACRVVLGIFEAGLGSGSVYLISMYYKRYELPWRLSLWYQASILAGAFGGLLAYAIAKMDGIRGYHGWRWIFILEGLLSAVVAISMKWWLPDWPEQAKFLTAEERAVLIQRLALEKDSGIGQMNRLDRTALRRIASDWKIYVATLIYFGVVNTNYSLSFFIPTILKELGYTAAMAQVRSIPIYVVASACCLVSCALSDRLRHRYGFVMSGIVLGTIGYAVLLSQEHVTIGVRYMAIFFVASAGYIVQPLAVSWLANNSGGHYKRSVGSAFQIGFGNLGGIVGSNVFITKEAPRYRTGYRVGLSLLLFSGLMASIFWIGLVGENRRRAQGKRDYRLSLSEEELENIGDDHPRFRFAT